MLYKFRRFLILGLFLLAGCLPRSEIRPAATQDLGQSAVAATDTQLVEGQSPQQVAITDTPQIESQNPEQVAGSDTPPAVTETYTVQPSTETFIPELTVTSISTEESILQVSPVPSYFEGFPEEYHTIQLPQPIIEILNTDGFVVPLPVDTGPLQEQLISAAQGFDLSKFDFERIVHFPPDPANEHIAVPVRESYYADIFAGKENFGQGVLVGLMYDRNGSFSGIPDAYEIWAYDNYVALVGLRVKAVLLYNVYGQYHWRAQDTTSNLPLVVFIKNGCWLCWRVDSRCGCLVCRD